MNTGTMAGDRERALEDLSALVDGEGEELRVTRACQQWRVDGEWRASWHAYHLIGDVLRSDDLASDPARDARFLTRLRARLDDEPVPLAPARVGAPARADAADPADAPQASPAAPAGRSRRRWRASSAVAVATGFVVVAGALLVTRAPEGPPASARGATAAAPGLAAADATPDAVPAGPTLASTTGGLPLTAAGPVTVGSEAAPVSPGPRASIASGKLIRDVRLDRYLAAHKEFAGSAALGVPSGFLRNATADASDR